MLSSMQQKLDNLCEQVNSSKEDTIAVTNKLSTKDEELQLGETFGTERIKFVDCGCWHCEQHHNELMVRTHTQCIVVISLSFGAGQLYLPIFPMCPLNNLALITH